MLNIASKEIVSISKGQEAIITNSFENLNEGLKGSSQKWICSYDNE